MNKQSRPKGIWMLVLLLGLLSLGGLVGGLGLIAAADGSIMQMSVQMLEGSPFQNFLLPGVLLFLLNGIYPLLAAYSVVRRPGWGWANALNPVKSMHWSWAAALLAGVIMMIWISVQMIMVGYQSLVQPFYLAWGAAIVLLALTPGVRQDLKMEALRERSARRSSEFNPRGLPGRRSQPVRAVKKRPASKAGTGSRKR